MSQRLCEKCGSNRLIEKDDKSRPPSGYAGMIAIYHKLYECKDCAHVNGSEESK